MSAPATGPLAVFAPWLPLIFVVVGLTVYALATNPKAAEVGRLSFLAGLLALLLR